MCGIAGLLAATGSAPIEQSVLVQMQAALRGRGPDDGNIFLDTSNSVGLAARRLAITDPSPNAVMPMSTANSALWISYNGEIYNHLELRKQIIEADPRPFRTASDTETVLRAYEQWGDVCVERFEGMFAFGLWDCRKKRLILARDRAGQKPLFWAPTPRGLVFASDVRSLFMSQWLSPCIRPQAVADYLTLLATPEPGTFFEGVFAVEAGTLLTVTPETTGRPQTCRYWDACDFLNDPSNPRSGAFQGNIATLLSEAVVAMVPRSTPYAVMLSGGVDSGLIAAFLNARDVPAPDAFETLAPGVGDPQHDVNGAQAIAAQLKCVDGHNIRHFSDQELIASHLALTKVRLDAPSATLDAVMLYDLAQRLSGRGTRVCFTGEGADEIGGYPSYLKYAHAPLSRFVQAYTSAEVESIWTAGPVRNPIDPLADIAGRIDRSLHDAPLRQMTAIEFQFRLPSFMLPRVDAASMSCGVELRAPFLHEPLMEAFLRAPFAIKFANQTAKAPLKALFADYFGAQAASKSKIGFGRPLSDMLSRTAHVLMRDRLFRAGGDAIEAYLNRELLVALSYAEQPDGFRMFTLVALSLWLEAVADMASAGQRDPGSVEAVTVNAQGLAGK